MYLGLPVGANPGDRKVWKLVVDRVKKRLENWKNNYLSFGGRIMLTNAVL